MDQRIKKARELVEVSECSFVLWSGMYWNKENRLVKIRETRLNLLYKDRDTIRFKRIPPRVEDSRSYPYSHKVHFTGDHCYRIGNGRRSGTVVSAADVEEGENFKPAGIDKVLEEGRSPNQFSLQRIGDTKILQLLETVPSAVSTTCMDSVCPALYLTVPASRGKLYLRNTGNALSYLHRTREYDPSETPNQNLRRLQLRLGMDAGNDRKAFPFEHITGQGVLAASAMSPTMSFGIWYSVPSIEFDTEHMRIAL